MELGNFFFGHSRGNYPVPRTPHYEHPFLSLIEVVTGDYTAYVPEFVNDTFELHPYWWGDCNCKAQDIDALEHESTCGINRPNFLYKPSGYELRVYKYALRDSYASHKLSPKEFRTMIDECIKSVRQ